MKSLADYTTEQLINEINTRYNKTTSQYIVQMIPSTKKKFSRFGRWYESDILVVVQAMKFILKDDIWGLLFNKLEDHKFKLTNVLDILTGKRILDYDDFDKYDDISNFDLYQKEQWCGCLRWHGKFESEGYNQTCDTEFVDYIPKYCESCFYEVFMYKLRKIFIDFTNAIVLPPLFELQLVNPSIDLSDPEHKYKYKDHFVHLQRLAIKKYKGQVHRS